MAAGRLISAITRAASRRWRRGAMSMIGISPSRGARALA